MTGGTAFDSSLLRGREKMPREACVVAFGCTRMLALDDCREGVLGRAALRGMGG